MKAPLIGDGVTTTLDMGRLGQDERIPDADSLDRRLKELLKAQLSS